MALKAEPQSTWYSVKITKKGLLAVFHAENYPQHPYVQEQGALCEQLLRFDTIKEVEYDPHFGNFIMFEMWEGSTEMDAVLKLIQQYLDAVM